MKSFVKIKIYQQRHAIQKKNKKKQILMTKKRRVHFHRFNYQIHQQQLKTVTPINESQLRSIKTSKKYRFVILWVLFTSLFFLMMEFFSVQLIQVENDFILQAKYPLPFQRTYQVAYNEQWVKTVLILPYESSSSPLTTSELLPYTSVFPYLNSKLQIQEEKDQFKITWEELQPQTECGNLTIQRFFPFSSLEKKHCLQVPVNHYELIQGERLFQATTNSTILLPKSQLEEGLNDLEWIAINPNTKDIRYPIELEFYQLWMDEAGELRNNSPYLHLIYELDSPNGEWVPLSDETTPAILNSFDTQVPTVELKKHTVSGQTLTVQAIGEDNPQLLSLHLRSQYYEKTFHFFPELSYASGINKYVLKIGTQQFESQTGTFTIPNLSSGDHQFTLISIDHAGNPSSEITQSFTIENPKPTQTQSTSLLNQSANTSSNQQNQSNSDSTQSSNNGVQSSLLTGQKAQWLYEMTTCHPTLATSDCLSIVNSAHNYLPEKVVRLLYQGDATIEIMPNNIRQLVRNITGWDPGWNYQGVTFYNTHGQYRHIFTSLKGGRNIYIHEIGHMYDYLSGRLSTQDDFIQLYQAEKGMFTGLYASDSVEFFAETFRIYLTNPNTLKTQAPLTYNYFKQLL